MVSAPSDISAALRVGYDEAILKRLPPRLRAELNQIGVAWGATAFVLAVPLGYAAWLIEKSVFLSLGVASFVVVLLFNLLRLINSGGGGAPDLPQARFYRPPWIPALLFFVLALLVAQPAQLLVPSSTAEDAVGSHRAALVEQHSQSVKDLALSAESHFEGRLAECEFILLRLRLVWLQPGRATLASAVFCLFALFPLFLMHGPSLDAVQAYERLRYQRLGRAMLSHRAATKRAVERALIRFETYEAPAEAARWLRGARGEAR